MIYLTETRKEIERNLTFFRCRFTLQKESSSKRESLERDSLDIWESWQYFSELPPSEGGGKDF